MKTVIYKAILQLHKIFLLSDCEDVSNYEKKRLENIDAKKQFFNSQLKDTISALKIKPTKPFQCPNCSKGYKNEQSLNGHRCSYCEVCKKNFVQYPSFLKHNRNVHSKEIRIEMSNQKPKRDVNRLVQSLNMKSLKYRSVENRKINQH